VSQPLVALSATTKIIDGLPRVRLNEAYVNAVRSAGLVPIVLPPVDAKELDAVLDAVQGVVLTGGEDIDPAEYGQRRRPEVEAVHTRRDACEIALARRARERRLPTLAICRGIQVVNVAFGGTLIQDIPAQQPSGINHDQSKERAKRLHDVRVEKNSRLARALDATQLSVNSSHHQSVDRVAEGFKVTARAPDGIIEGMETPDDEWWMLAVQWHPEELIDDSKPWDRGLFKAFARQIAG
jgi:putative glutamine amidotransferase